MKKIISLFVSAMAVLSLSAQTPATTPTKKAAEKTMVKDVSVLKTERKERNNKILKAKFRQAGKEQGEINVARKDLHANKKHLKNKGVKTPVADAKAKVGGGK